MNPNVWGPPAWTFLHTITFTYPDNPTINDKQNMYNFFTSLSSVLPCDKCKINFNKHLEKHPLTGKVLCSRNNLSRWLVDIHNEVNKIKHKPTISYEQAEDYYNNMYSRRYDCISFAMSVSVGVILLIILLIVIFLAYKRYFG